MNREEFDTAIKQVICNNSTCKLTCIKFKGHGFCAAVNKTHAEITDIIDAFENGKPSFYTG